MIDSRVIPTVMAWLGHAIHAFAVNPITLRQSVKAGGNNVYDGDWDLW
jgi:hypothetical protein